MRSLLCIFGISAILFVTVVFAKTTTYVITKGEAVVVEEDLSAEEENLQPIGYQESDAKDKDLVESAGGWIQGDCGKNRRPLIYTENFLLDTDNNSQVSGSIQIMIGNNANITCVDLFDRGEGKDHPRIIQGGVGHDRVSVFVSPGYGKGFDFTVKLYGFFN